jgi:hypothetical protein
MLDQKNKYDYSSSPRSTSNEDRTFNTIYGGLRSASYAESRHLACDMPTLVIRGNQQGLGQRYYKTYSYILFYMPGWSSESPRLGIPG